MMHDAQVSNIKLSIMRRELHSMFESDAFVLPDSFEEDEIDIFAELGVKNSGQFTNPATQLQEQNENLAILLSNDEMVTQQDANDIEETNSKTVVIETSSVSLPDETISELLEILVKQELHTSDGEQITSNVPGNAKVNLASAKVVKRHDEYEISVIIDVDGSGPVRPFAKIKTQNNILSPSEAPASIPKSWIPLHDILRDLLTKAMQMLSSTKFAINHNA